MPDMLQTFRNWWKTILGLALLTTLITAVVVFLKKAEYLSMSTALPASSLNADKGRVFSERIEGLYSPFGASDELDRMIGTAELDTVYLWVASRQNLAKHYSITGDHALYNAARKLKKKQQSTAKRVWRV